MDTPTKPRGCTSFKVRQLSRRLSQHYDAEVSQSGLKTTQYSLLSHLARLGPTRPVDLAAELKMTASTLSRNLQPLIVAGWITQGAGADARSRLVQLTEEGEIKRREALAHWKTAQQKLNALLGVERVLALHLLIDEAMELLGGEDEPVGDD
ncbi:MarR family winged helix-turn-helix transcriptional regulator [Variovorax sp. NFACC27]|uniref:MarR family transcriptional regulator n=1 Tax=Variovorax gossypii TaxID=1679495 RepID=A0A431TFA6_9BURK|nr:MULTISPECIES: MarR family winged helix-turn-helix transcriptional regulator [Variovorax]MDP9606609.1 DNA-binding MarR family transcriptional regulator [Variovorax paradoxus]SEF24870.1 DNA-binding transcriptional regulator, MarR family [Variovorax sp. NFACC28]SEG31427.1 DNA-binding transcriptional regulator, MarR family [Variovorax sp. NFACC29]SFC40411.1 DNA-binding transcriptional regulator, MarR family [Variovorax sp. NFACC26]SFF90061.1 DNA-binding transcriptional regulator, MarR family [V